MVRADGIGQGCRSLPEDHGVVFPGGTVLVGGAAKMFDGDAGDYVLERELRSPNGEDVLYVYFRGSDGTYLLYAYNLIDKAIAAPIHCHGYSLFGDGRMIVMRASAEPTRVHPMQVWRTPFTSAEHAASAPTDGSYLAKVGNADLVRGLSDALSIARLAGADAPVRTTFDDILGLATRAIDQYYWLGHADAGDLRTAVADVKTTARLILDEYDKVVALEAEARRVLAAMEALVAERLRATRSEGFDKIDPFLDALTGLRALRGELITRQDVRFIDTARLAALEAEVAAAFDRVTMDCARFLVRGDAFGELVDPRRRAGDAGRRARHRGRGQGDPRPDRSGRDRGRPARQRDRRAADRRHHPAHADPGEHHRRVRPGQPGARGDRDPATASSPPARAAPSSPPRSSCSPRAWRRRSPSATRRSAATASSRACWSSSRSSRAGSPTSTS